LGIETNK